MATQTTEVAAQHILASISPEKSPLFVAIQGPQGSGKTYLSARLKDILSSPPHSLNVAVLSIDDIYLPHESLLALAADNPSNPLWRGRGQPGTHDLGLGVEILNALKNGHHSIELPRFDKSLFDGEGDRLPTDGTGTMIQPPVDVVIMEGWCMGFRSIPSPELSTIWNSEWETVKKDLQLSDTIVGDLENLKVVSEMLSKYDVLWDFFDTFIQIRPATLSNKIPSSSPHLLVYKWRLNQEHYMKAQNGGRGMSDEQVKTFVDRYIPGYVFFGGGIQSPVSKWRGKSLAVLIDQDLGFVESRKF